MSSEGWRPFQWFLLRGTGLPFAWLEELADDDVEGARAALSALVERPLFREAVFVSNPELERRDWARWLTERRNSKARGRERMLMRYVQRFCAKNDSTSFFGAVGLGRFDRVQSAETEHPIVAERRVFLTHWFVQALLDKAAAELAAAGVSARRPERAPGVVDDPDEPFAMRLGPRGRMRRVDDDEVELTDAWSRLPVGLARPIGEAVRRLEAQPASPQRDDWLARLSELDALRARLETTPWPARRAAGAALDAWAEAHLEAEPQRRAGRFYASRGVYYESCARTEQPVGLAPGWAEAIVSAAAPWFEVARVFAGLPRARFAAWFDGAAGGSTGRVPWREVHAAWRDDPVGRATAGGPRVAALDRAARTLRAAIAEADGRLDPADLRATWQGVAELLDPGAFANPDLMVAQTPGGPQVVLGEGHHLPCLTPYLTQALPQHAALVDDTRHLLARLCGGASPGFVFAYPHSFVSVTDDFGGVALELSGRSARADERRASFAELRVERHPGGFAFTTGEGRPVAPLTRVTRLDLAAPVYPVSMPDLGALTGRHTRPRTRFGELVVGRRCWRVDSARWAAHDAPIERLRALCPDLPRFTFLRTASEPKPQLVDWRNPLSAELAVWLAGRTRHVDLEEMLPGPRHLWLRGPDGLHTSELRMVWTRPA